MTEIMVRREKYVTVIADTSSDANEYHVEYTEKGYRLHTQNAVPYTVDGVPYREIILTYSLQEDSKYENITNLKDVDPSDVDTYIAKGWTVTESWSKIVRMVKR